jgi:hypothetical protein
MRGGSGPNARPIARPIAMLIALLAAGPLSAATAVPPTAAPAPRPLQVLFVGNSLTFGNDLPTTFETLYRATAPGAQVRTQMLAVGGAVLRDHIDTGHLSALLEATRYDVVVLQELGGWPLCDAHDPLCQSPEHLRRSVQLVRAHGARPLWYGTWKAAPDEQKEMSRRSRRIAADIGVELVDTGAAMQHVASVVRARLLLDDAARHADVAGTWLVAALLVQATSTQPLPTATPPESCGRTWTSHRTTAARDAEGPRRCHRLTDLQWQRLRAAAVRQPRTFQEPPTP